MHLELGLPIASDWLDVDPVSPLSNALQSHALTRRLPSVRPGQGSLSQQQAHKRPHCRRRHGAWILAWLVRWKGGGVCGHNATGGLYSKQIGTVETNLITLDAMAASWTMPLDGLLVNARPIYPKAMQANCLSFRGRVARKPFLNDLIANGVDSQAMLAVVGTGRFPGSATKFRVSVWLASRAACSLGIALRLLRLLACSCN